MESERRPILRCGSGRYTRLTPEMRPELSMIDDNLYLGNYAAARVAKQFDLKAVLTVSQTVMSDRDKTDGIEYYGVMADDKATEDLISYFPLTNQWISECVDTDRPILVHCMAGVSRSATIVCAYLMQRHRLSPEEAIGWVAANRPIIRPNRGFRRQLELFYKMDYKYDPSDIRLQRFWALASIHNT